MLPLSLTLLRATSKEPAFLSLYMVDTRALLKYTSFSGAVAAVYSESLVQALNAVAISATKAKYDDFTKFFIVCRFFRYSVQGV